MRRRCRCSPTAWSTWAARGSWSTRSFRSCDPARSWSWCTRSTQAPGEGLLARITETFRFLTDFWWQFLVAGALAAGIALVVARWLARGMTQPLRDMAAAAHQMETGDYSQRVHTRSRDEVGQLATAFNRMSAELQDLEQSRRDLLANVSHELKTPITAIRAHLENLLDGVEQPDPATLQVMLTQTERLGRLIEQLLELSRLESGELPLLREETPLAPLVTQVLSEIEVARSDRGVAVESAAAHRSSARRRRPRTRPSGPVQPGRQRGAVHPRGRCRDGVGARVQRLGRDPGGRHGRRASRPSTFPGCSNGSTGPTRPVRGRTAAPASGSRSRARWSRRTEGTSRRRASSEQAACSRSIYRSRPRPRTGGNREVDDHHRRGLRGGAIRIPRPDG